MRQRTRTKLLDAALRVMGKKGVDRATIAEITEEAGLGFGSFYNHFSSKEEIALAVFSLKMEELAKTLDHIAIETTNIYLAISFIQRTMIEHARRDPLWGWFTVHADYSLRQFNTTFRERAARDIRRGMKSKHLNIPDLDIAVAITISTLNAVIREILEGNAPPDAASRCTEYLMRMYGISKEDAAKSAYQPLPDFHV